MSRPTELDVTRQRGMLQLSKQHNPRSTNFEEMSSGGCGLRKLCPSVRPSGNYHTLHSTFVHTVYVTGTLRVLALINVQGDFASSRRGVYRGSCLAAPGSTWSRDWDWTAAKSLGCAQTQRPAPYSPLLQHVDLIAGRPRVSGLGRLGMGSARR